MILQEFSFELQDVLKHNEMLQTKLDRYEIYIKKLTFDNGGILNIKPFENSEEREQLKANYDLAFGITTIELIKN